MIAMIMLMDFLAHSLHQLVHNGWQALISKATTQLRMDNDPTMSNQQSIATT
jgi:hypothetical protein